MGTSYTQSKNLKDRRVIKLLALKDGRLSAVFEDEIEIYSKNNLELEISIEGKENLKNLTQLNNGNLIISFHDKIKFNDIIKMTKIISLKEKSYNIEQELENEFYSEKILEKDDCLYSFEQNSFHYEQGEIKSCINIYKKFIDNNKYKKIAPINNFNKLQNQNWSWFIDACFINNNEVMLVLSNGIKFLNINNPDYSNEITNYHNEHQVHFGSLGSQTSGDFICNLNNNSYLIGGDNKFYIVDAVRYNINLIIQLEEENKIIKEIKKDFNNQILVIMDNKYRSMKDRYRKYDYFCVYKYESDKLEKISELKEENKYIDLFEILNDNQVVFLMHLYISYFSYERNTYLNILSY